MEDETPITLDDASVEAIARRIHELLAEGASRGGEPLVVTATEVARRLGRTRAWVYRNADRLAALRLGEGPRPRLMFDLAEVEARIRAGRAEAPTIPPPWSRARETVRRQRVLPEAELLPVGPSRPSRQGPDGT